MLSGMRRFTERRKCSQTRCSPLYQCCNQKLFLVTHLLPRRCCRCRFWSPGGFLHLTCNPNKPSLWSSTILSTLLSSTCDAVTVRICLALIKHAVPRDHLLLATETAGFVFSTSCCDDVEAMYDNVSSAPKLQQDVPGSYDDVHGAPTREK